ncbi:hypothetical protein G6F65_017007 [Rhizopus arrhizus]|nr:hypothetical protein G6F65_017007 [Rhizopus arrhizus]
MSSKATGMDFLRSGGEKNVCGLGYIHGTTFRRQMLTCPSYGPGGQLHFAAGRAIAASARRYPEPTGHVAGRIRPTPSGLGSRLAACQRPHPAAGHTGRRRRPAQADADAGPQSGGAFARRPGVRGPIPIRAAGTRCMGAARAGLAGNLPGAQRRLARSRFVALVLGGQPHRQYDGSARAVAV